MKKFKRRFRRWMNMLMLRDKLLYLFLLCVLLPLIVTDGFIIYNFSTISTTKQKHELSEYAEAVEAWRDPERDPEAGAVLCDADG